jgi:hypothetical protein
MTAWMSDAVFFAVVGLVAAAMIALALVWPQGLGARSPDPFGHPPAAQRQALEPRPAEAELKGVL